jgi:NAD(P)H-hydrate epimerase
MWAVNAEQMRELDRRTIEEVGIPGVVLMENAARGALCVLWRAFPDLERRRVALLCGRGNNGGDGLAMARHLLQKGVVVEIHLTGPPERLSPNARVQWEILKRLGVDVGIVGTPEGVSPSQLDWDRFDVVVDALLGTGLRSEVRGTLAELVHLMNRCPAPVFAVDIPSGLSSDDGRPLGETVRAHLTATFGLPKVGQFLFPGRAYCGDLWVVDIGIPQCLVEEIDPRARIVDPESLKGIIYPRDPASHKGSFGHLLVLAGSPGKTGAGIMASEAALRVGAGLVTLGLPKSLDPTVQARLIEAMTLPLPEGQEQSLSRAALGAILEAMEGKAAVVMGPGLSTMGETPSLVRDVLKRIRIPVVVDADGLNALVGHLELISAAQAPVVLTPHPGEMARLMGRTVREIQEDRIGWTLQLSQRIGAYVVLKGAGTVIAGPEGSVSLVPSGNPALASGGTGDVLSGMIGGLLAQGLPVLETLELAVYLHGLVGDLWAEAKGDRGLMATDLLDRIPETLNRLGRGEIPRRWPQTLEGCPFHV